MFSFGPALSFTQFLLVTIPKSYTISFIQKNYLQQEDASTLSATSSTSFAQTPMRHFNKIMNDRKKEIDAFQGSTLSLVKTSGWEFTKVLKANS